MRARGAVILGRLGCGTIVIGQGNQAEDLSGGGITALSGLPADTSFKQCPKVVLFNSLEAARRT